MADVNRIVIPFVSLADLAFAKQQWRREGDRKRKDTRRAREGTEGDGRNETGRARGRERRREGKGRREARRERGSKKGERKGGREGGRGRGSTKG